MRSTWTDDGFISGAEPASDAVVFESFLVSDGRIRELHRHHRRLSRSCRALRLGVGEDRLAAFVEGSLSQLPGRGRWFPRLEVHHGGALVLWLRPAPDPRGEAVLWCGPAGDPRRYPTHKGPDLAVLARLRATALDVGADDALIRDGRGQVLEAGHHGLMWWEGPDLCVVDPELPRLPSVTLELIAEHVRSGGGRVRARRVVLANLLGVEVWAVNALHGIRVVSRWQFEDGTGWWAPAPDRARLDRIRGVLDGVAAFRMQPAGGR